MTRLSPAISVHALRSECAARLARTRWLTLSSLSTDLWNSNGGAVGTSLRASPGEAHRDWNRAVCGRAHEGTGGTPRSVELRIVLDEGVRASHLGASLGRRPDRAGAQARSPSCLVRCARPS